MSPPADLESQTPSSTPSTQNEGSGNNPCPLPPVPSFTNDVAAAATPTGGTATEGIASGDDNTPESETGGVKKRKGRLRSFVWNHYKKKKGGEQSTCNYCGQDFASASVQGTTGLKRHLLRCKQNPNRQIDKKQKTIDFSPNKEPVWKYNNDLSRQNLARMIIDFEKPFRIVERDTFKEFVKSLNPKADMPGRHTVARDIVALYGEEKLKLKQYFLKSKQRVCLTTDTWTSIKNHCFMALTGHYIDSDWKLNKMILNFCEVESHSGEAMGQAVERCLTGWEINRVLTVTVDNASANDNLVNHLKRRFQVWNTAILKGEFSHVRCVAHILNLTVKDGLKDIGVSISRIRTAVRFWKASSSRLQRFKAIVEQEKLVWTVSLSTDVDTRWNSTYDMLEKALKYRKAFECLEGNSGSRYVRELNSGVGVPTTEDWEYAEAVLPFLKIFYDATHFVSGTSYATSNNCMVEVCKISMQIKERLNDCQFAEMAAKMRKKHDKYWNNMKNINMLLFVAAVLDPRRKMVYVEWMIDVCYSGTIIGQLKEKLNSTLESLYDQYKKSHGIVKATPLDKTAAPQIGEVNSGDVDYMDKIFMSQTGVQEADEKSELEKYFREDREPSRADFDILNWWKVNSARYPILASMARDVLAIPVSSVASESAFSAGGRVLDKHRSSLSAGMLEALICMNDWMKNGRGDLSSLEAELEEEEEEECEEISAALSAFPMSTYDYDD